MELWLKHCTHSSYIYLWLCLFHLVQMHISYSSCAKAKTNLFSSISLWLSLRSKGKWSFRQRQGFHSNSDGITYPLPLLIYLSICITFHSYFFYQWGRKYQGLSCSLFLALNAKGEKILSPKQKDRTTISKFLNNKFFNWYLIFNWYVKVKFQIGIYFKTLLKAKRKIDSGELLLSQSKNIWNRGRNFQILKCFLQS